LGDLAALGYDAEWDCIPAAGVGAPHLRDRLYLVAYPGIQQQPREQQVGVSLSDAHTHRERREECFPTTVAERARFDRRRAAAAVRTWGTEPDVGRVADGVPARVDRLRGLGNAVVPQIPELIGGWIIEHAKATGYLEAVA